MRSIAAVLVTGCALLTLTSCSDVPSDTPDESAGGESSTVQHAEPADSHQSHESHAGHGEHPAGDAHVAADHAEHAASSESPHSKDEHSGGHDQHASASADEPKAHGRTGHGRHAGHGHGSDSAAPKIAIGEKVPDFEVTLNGKALKLSELREHAGITPDGTLVLTFWCSFCHSCRDIELDLEKLAKAYQGKAGVIALDASFGETAEDIAAFAKKKGLTLPIALSSDGSAADLFGVNKTTTTVVIDGKGTLRYFGQFGGRGRSYAEDALKSVLAGKDVTVQSTPPRG